MSGITLSASVRQNLLSLQSTADLLSTTQNRLATGNKVNSALDNPTNFFTAQGLNNRASDINNLLDGIGNGVQILQAANTGITSLQKLVDSAKSIANQALQATTGYSTKSQVTTAAVSGATASNLLGTTSTTYTPGTFTGTAVTNDQTGGGAGNITGATILGGTASGTSDNLGTAAALNGKTLTVNGQTLTFSSTDPTAVTATGGTISTTGDVQDVLDAINTIAGAGTASINNGQISISTGATATGTTLGGTALSNFGLNTGTQTGITGSPTTIVAGGTALVGTATTTGGLSGETLNIAATAGGKALSITFGAGTASIDNDTGVASNINTLDDLNKVLALNNMQASLGSDGSFKFTTTNDYASSTLGAFTGTATGAGNAFGAITIGAPAADANAQNTRASLVAQYNTVMDQIKTTASDSSFNGVNLLNGDTLALTFNETGKSKLSITGVTFDTTGLGLASLTKGTDFLDNAGTNKILTSLNDASSKLRSQASAFGSNLSVVQMRQDFSKQMINVLQNGASALTLADTNEEAANSQALSTRQSIAVSALSLANQSQQGVLQLLR